MNNAYTYRVNANVVPKKLFYKGQLRNIVEVDDHLIIKEYKIIVEEKSRITRVFISDGCHPNINPHTGEYCMPYSLRGIKLSDENLEKIEKTMEIYNLQSCYEIPYGFFKYDGKEII